MLFHDRLFPGLLDSPLSPSLSPIFVHRCVSLAVTRDSRVNSRRAQRVSSRGFALTHLRLLNHPSRSRNPPCQPCTTHNTRTTPVFFPLSRPRALRPSDSHPPSFIVRRERERERESRGADVATGLITHARIDR